MLGVSYGYGMRIPPNAGLDVLPTRRLEVLVSKDGGSKVPALLHPSR